MAEQDIATKLRESLKEPKDVLLTEEGAVYLMVQIRKLIDFDDQRTDRLKTIKFYCDWLMHSSKDRNMKHIEDDLRLAYWSIYMSIFEPKKMPIPQNFLILVSLNKLNEDLREIFSYYNFNDSLLTKAVLSDKFHKALLRVLLDQPLNTPNDFEIEQLTITEADDTGFKVKAIFRNPLTLPDGKIESQYEYRLDTTPL